MQIVSPENIEIITPTITTATNKRPWHFFFFEHANAVINIIFMVLELLVGVSIIGELLLYGWNIFHKWNSVYIAHAGYMIKSIHHYWIGFVFVFALIFFRVILLKFSKLRDARAGLFDKGVKIYSTEGD